MKITYECNCDNFTKFLTQQILKDADVEPKEFRVTDVDDRRIHIQAKVFNKNAAPVIMGMTSGAWEEHHWVIKRDMEVTNEIYATVEYVLFDWTACNNYEYGGHKGITLIHFVPKPISEGNYELIYHEEDKSVEVSRGKCVRYTE